MKCESRSTLDCIEGIVLGKFESPSSQVFSSLVKGRTTWHFNLPNTISSKSGIDYIVNFVAPPPHSCHSLTLTRRSRAAQ